jgi:hypothetical protein
MAPLRLFKLSGDPSEFPTCIDLNRILRLGKSLAFAWTERAAQSGVHSAL